MGKYDGWRTADLARKCEELERTVERLKSQIYAMELKIKRLEFYMDR